MLAVYEKLTLPCDRSHIEAGDCAACSASLPTYFHCVPFPAYKRPKTLGASDVQLIAGYH
jgi:hypothetical protein